MICRADDLGRKVRWICNDLQLGHHGAGPINQIKPRNHQHGCGAEGQRQGVMHDEIASHHAKQRGDEGKSRQFAGEDLPPGRVTEIHVPLRY
jgi:hypothetical protein